MPNWVFITIVVVMAAGALFAIWTGMQLTKKQK